MVFGWVPPNVTTNVVTAVTADVYKPALPLIIVCLVPWAVTKQSIPLYSTAPFSTTLKLVPDISFNDAEPAAVVPAAICSLAVGSVVPKPIPTLAVTTFPQDKQLDAVVPPFIPNLFAPIDPM